VKIRGINSGKDKLLFGTLCFALFPLIFEVPQDRDVGGLSILTLREEESEIGKNRRS
jgi:hypothetical protein